ncbi:MAG: phenylalanine--tRNA ligase subunit beta [Prevotellaceae bacterium]|jgi:phenylalanyl-tRNA synthetase beta chain|nr:phenylalanine--tRNA ligase subunit beta [Prevotellaceae bacterium]
MNWIGDYVNLDGLNILELLKRFTLSTAEIDDVYYKGKEISNVVVGQIISVTDHPSSDKLHLLKISTDSQTYDCVCGATNVKVGIKVPFAISGGSVIEGKIETTTVAGCISEGMCCSEKELGISDDNSGLMILDSTLPLGCDVKNIFPIEDILFEVDNKSLTNRPDLWGHYGIAREFAAITGQKLNPLPLKELQYTGNCFIPVSVERPDLCFRYSCLRMDNVTRYTSPVNMKIRLYYCGMRSINYLADITNYIMLELGQPLHAFDSAKISNIAIKTFPETQDFTTLDGCNRQVDSNTLLICDGNNPVAIAGIMGGENSEISDNTNAVVLEAACFDATSIRKSATRIGLRTDASMRYEKSLDPELTMTAIKRFVYLMAELDCNAYISSVITDVYPFHYPQITIEFDKKYIDQYTGIDISIDHIKKTLLALGFETMQTNENFKVIVPSWRATKDVSIKADIVEELSRIYGYDNFVVKSTNSLLRPVKDAALRINDTLFKDILVLHHSLHEVHSYIWCDEKKFANIGINVESNVNVINGANGYTTLRNSMIPTLLCAVYDNKNYATSFGIFEIGRVVHGFGKNGFCNERRTLGIVLFSKGRDEVSLYVKATSIVNNLLIESKHIKPIYKTTDLLHNWQHPKNTKGIYYDNQQIGIIGTIHPMNLDLLERNSSVVYIEIDMDTIDTLAANKQKYQEPSKYPSIDFDLTVHLNSDSEFSTVREIVDSCALADCTDIKVVDIYRLEKGLNVTIRLEFLSFERTLVKDDIQANVDILISLLENNGFKLS